MGNSSKNMTKEIIRLENELVNLYDSRHTSFVYIEELEAHIAELYEDELNKKAPTVDEMLGAIEEIAEILRAGYVSPERLDSRLWEILDLVDDIRTSLTEEDTDENSYSIASFFEE